ncbi:MAG: hypothetical protein ABI415_01905 [Flavitalea sp.]
MQKETNILTSHLFQKDNLEQVDAGDIESLVQKYPYFGAARYLLAKKAYRENGQEPQDEMVTAGLYFNNPLRLNWLLTHNEPEIETPMQDQEKQETTSTDESPIAFQSYHTIDYFASQGIRLQQAELTKDRLGQQLKSFTEWLRSMKKLPNAETEGVPAAEDHFRQQHVIETAAHSIKEKEVFTEAMAEVWAKQGNTSRAIGIYDKLSLQNPGKSGYFAAKIDQLKGL